MTLNETTGFPRMIRDKNDKRMIRAVFPENKKYYPQIFLVNVCINYP